MTKKLKPKLTKNIFDDFVDTYLWSLSIALQFTHTLDKKYTHVVVISLLNTYCIFMPVIFSAVAFYFSNQRGCAVRCSNHTFSPLSLIIQSAIVYGEKERSFALIGDVRQMSQTFITLVTTILSFLLSRCACTQHNMIKNTSSSSAK